MKIRHQIEAPELDNTKKRILESPWIPIGCMAVTVLCVFMSRKQAQIVINVTKETS